jgi:hypothetical protein
MKEIGKKLSAGMLFNKIVDSNTFTSNLQIEQYLGAKEERTLRKTLPDRVKLHAVCVKLQEVCVERDGFRVETHSY